MHKLSLPGLLLLGVVFHLSSLAWGVPGADSWANDSVASRDHLAGVALNLQPGNFFRYPLLHLLVLALLSLPVVVAALFQTGFAVSEPGFQARLIQEVVREPYMTWALVTGRLLTVLMSAVSMWALFRIGERLWGRRAGLFTVAVLLTNTWFNYYSQTTNLDLPQLMWVLLAVERALAAVTGPVDAGAKLRRHAGVCAALAVATKDQAAGVLLLGLPAVALLGLLGRRARPVSDQNEGVFAEVKRWLPAVGVAAVVYIVACGALFNPSGYVARVKWLLGPASKEWTEYTGDLGGRLALLQDVVPKLAGEAYLLPIGLAGLLGLVGLVLFAVRHKRWLWLLPVVLAGSMTLLFNLGALRSSPRFLLAQSVMLALSAGWLLDLVWQRSTLTAVGERSRGLQRVVATCLGILFLLGLSWSARVNHALLTDARTDATSWLRANAPTATKVEVYAKNFALLRLPPHLDATRVRQTPLHKRNPIVGLREIKAPFENLATREPDLVVLIDKHYGTFIAPDRGKNRRRSRVTESRSRDAAACAHFKGLLAGSSGYDVVFRKAPSALWPWPPMYIHASVSPIVVIVARRGWRPNTAAVGDVVESREAKQ